MKLMNIKNFQNKLKKRKKYKLNLREVFNKNDKYYI